MKADLIFIHGGEAFSDYQVFLEHLRTQEIDPFKERSKRWTDTLKEDLIPEYVVIQPGMPNKQNAKYEEWKIWFERHLPYLKDGAGVVGWSQGGMFLVKYLLENECSLHISHLYLIAVPFKVDDFGGEDGGDFVFDTSQVATLAHKAKHIHIFHSKDDFVVPYEHAEEYKAALPQAELVTFTDRNHFLQEEFPELLEHIKRATTLA